MDRTIKLWLNILLFVFIIMVVSFIISYNSENKTSLLLAASLLITSVSTRYLFFYESERFYKWGPLSILFDAVIIYFLSVMDKYGIAEILYLVLIGDSIIFYRTFYSVFITLAGFFSYLLIVYMTNEFTGIKEFIPYVLTSSLSILFITVVMSIVKYVINQHDKLKETMKSLEAAHQKLKETSKQLEQIAVIKERNRIASEVHDTVGHTLTTVLIEIEAGKCILKKNPDEAIDKLELALQQVRNGLDNIMRSVKAINGGTDLPGEFISSMEKIIRETEIHTGISIKYELSHIPQIPKDMQTALFRALKEGLTNGIRHGHCRTFIFSLKAEDSIIKFRLKDDGIGCTDIVPGFGIKTMRERLESLGGFAEITSSTGNGCELSIEIPFERDVKYEENQNIDCR